MISRSERVLHWIQGSELSVQAEHVARKEGLGGCSSNLYVRVMMRPRRVWSLWWITRAIDAAQKATLDATVRNVPGAWGGFNVTDFRQATARLKVPLPDNKRHPGLKGWGTPKVRDPADYHVFYRIALEYRRKSFRIAGDLVVAAAHPDDDRNGAVDTF